MLIFHFYISLDSRCTPMSWIWMIIYGCGMFMLTQSCIFQTRWAGGNNNYSISVPSCNKSPKRLDTSHCKIHCKETKKTKTTSSVVPSRPKSSHVQTSIFPSSRPTKICLTGAADNLRTEDSCAPNPICPE